MEATVTAMSTTKTGMVSVPFPTLRRLPGYHHYLVGLRDAGRAKVSCTTIAADLHLGPTQVRKDLEATGIVGRPKIGYDLGELIGSIESFLGWNDHSRAFIAGVGDLGSALLGYPGFKQYGFDIVAGFDVDPAKVGTEIHGKPILPLEKLANLPKRMHITIGIIAVPAAAAQGVADLMTRGGITAIWNFAPVGLRVPEGVVVQNEDLASSLAVLLRKHVMATGRTASPELEH
jgi:redox-sensing transcriptional repressor